MCGIICEMDFFLLYCVTDECISWSWNIPFGILSNLLHSRYIYHDFYFIIYCFFFVRINLLSVLFLLLWFSYV